LNRLALSEQSVNAKKSKSARGGAVSALDLFPESLRREIDHTIDQIETLRGKVEGALAMSAAQ